MIVLKNTVFSGMSVKVNVMKRINILMKNMIAYEEIRMVLTIGMNPANQNSNEMDFPMIILSANIPNTQTPRFPFITPTLHNTKQYTLGGKHDEIHLIQRKRVSRHRFPGR